MKRIIVTVSGIGNPTVEAEGFTGGSCEQATKPIEDALAGKNAGMTRELKPEHSQVDTIEQQQTW